MDRELIGPEELGGRQRRDRRRRVALCSIVAVLVVVAALGWLDPLSSPQTLHVWGHDYEKTSNAVLNAVPAVDSEAPVLHSAIGPLGWFGLTDAGPKPAKMVIDIYLAVGPGELIAYEWRPCCEPTW